jgi:hypothetical protein
MRYIDFIDFGFNGYEFYAKFNSGLNVFALDQSSLENRISNLKILNKDLDMDLKYELDTESAVLAELKKRNKNYFFGKRLIETIMFYDTICSIH